MQDLDLDLQIPPAKSPLLLPTTRHLKSPASRLARPNSELIANLYLASGNAAAGASSSSSSVDDQLLDDIDSLGGGAQFNGEDDDDEESDEEEMDDFALEDGHIVGIPSSRLNLDAKRYETLEFCATLLQLLRDELRIAGWSTLASDLPASLLHIHKVSGALTNAVFFVSIPECRLDVSTAMPGHSEDHVIERATPLTFNIDLNASPSARSQQTDSSLVKAASVGSPAPLRRTETITVSAPTILLRIYGPSSGSLISRKSELHILHTLSSDYAIGPSVLGTFANGRVEQYVHSRALHKEELRDARISRWIGRRMRELHRVDLARMIMTDGPKGRDSSSSSRRGSLERPGIDIIGGAGSGTSIYSTSSGSSIFSFGTSIYSTSSAGSTTSLVTVQDDESLYGTPIVASPMMLPQRGSSESIAALKKRSRSGASRRGSRRMKDTSGVWDMITRWTREAKRVLKELDDLAATPGFSQLLTPPRTRSAAHFNSSTSSSVNSPAIAGTPSSFTSSSSSGINHEVSYIHPLSSPSLTFSVRASLNLPLFEQQIKLFRSHVRSWERRYGPSLRVFSHNDTQYGNLLLMTPKAGDQLIEGGLIERTLPHHQIFVVDFEYASANPRGFDIANHFIEWQADYHHPTLSHSLSAHGAFPTLAQRKRFIRAYVGCDGGVDSTPIPSSSSSSIYRSATIASSTPSSVAPSPGQSSSQSRSTRRDSPSLLRADHFTDASSSSTPSTKVDQEARQLTEVHAEDVDEDGDDSSDEDPRVDRLLLEAELWSPASHALWAVWGIVQAKEDLLKRVATWKEQCRAKEADSSTTTATTTAATTKGKRRDSGQTIGSGTAREKMGEADGTALADHEEALEGDADAAGEDAEQQEEEEEVKTDFDYLSYSLGRMNLFRAELKSLGVVDC